MNDTPKSPDAAREANDKAARLNAALRANLQRRKAATRPNPKPEAPDTALGTPPTET